MAKSLSTLLKKLEKSEKSYGIGKFEEMSSVWHDITEEPDNYILSIIEERTELRQIGHKEIPRRGQIIEIYDNDWYEPKRSKVKIPEFDSVDPEKEALVIEIVKDVHAYNRFKGQVRLVIEKYLIREK